jgi:hypothetical protein
MVGQMRCRFHGGKSPQALAAAQRRLAVERATRAIDREQLPPVNDPVAVLQALASEALALKDYFAQRVRALEELRYKGGAGEQVRGELLLYERALDRSARFCSDLARLGLDERQVRVSERQGELLAECIERALAVCGLSSNAPLRRAIASELRLLETG